MVSGHRELLHLHGLEFV